ncbi:hypothetical protein N7474_003498 [Penicillium riverlandense]|uniref:uncharacterized protein n=1 Tax=Penicillium riverlandense TaxID=1903569 RepID=UPI002546A94D|nr:uncharacterized protein N7474_003498 [Penicillium riverlandense]KAJ5826360.1 hypothetical protein N7474_003498 [Penicillium riverlandense]
MADAVSSLTKKQNLRGASQGAGQVLPAQQQRPSETLLYLANAFTPTSYSPPCLSGRQRSRLSSNFPALSSVHSISHIRDEQDRKVDVNARPRGAGYHTLARSGDISSPSTSRAPGVPTVPDETIHPKLTAKLRALAWYAKPPRRHHIRRDDYEDEKHRRNSDLIFWA